MKPHRIQISRDITKFQKQPTLLVYCLKYFFSDIPSKSTGCPFREAERKAVKVVNFVAMWLNLYPHTVYDSKANACMSGVKAITRKEHNNILTAFKTFFHTTIRCYQVSFVNQ